MPKEIDPKDSSRATAYKLWMKAPNPYSQQEEKSEIQYAALLLYCESRCRH